jgi:hypothetical protein
MFVTGLEVAFTTVLKIICIWLGYLLFLKKIVTMFEVSQLSSKIDIVSLVLSRLEDFGLQLGDDEVLLV